MKKLTVSLLSESFPPIIDGVANAVLNYAELIEREWGHAIVTVPSYPGAVDPHTPYRVVRYPSIDVRKATTGYTAGIPFSPEVMSQLTKQQVDILHAHSPMVSALLGRSLRKRMEAPLIMTYHTKFDIDIANVVKSKALQTFALRSLVSNISLFDEVWAVSDGAGRNLRSLGYQGDYIVMPNGVDLPKGRSGQADVERFTGSYDLPEGVPVYLYIGRLMWYKGFQITLDALRMLQEQGKDFRMIVIGNGGDGDEIFEYARQLRLLKKVFFLGTVSGRESIRAWYTRADLLLFPSTFDTNGLVVREAAACDLASVLVEGSCAAEDVTDGKNGFLIHEEAASMAQLLLKLYDQPDFVKEIGMQAGKDLYISWKDAVSLAVDRYHTVLDIYRSGGFEEHDRLSDNLLATQGDLMYTISRIANALEQTKSIAKLFLENVNTENTDKKEKSAK